MKMEKESEYGFILSLTTLVLLSAGSPECCTRESKYSSGPNHALAILPLNL